MFALLNNMLWATRSFRDQLSKLLHDPCFQFKLCFVPGNRPTHEPQFAASDWINLVECLNSFCGWMVLTGDSLWRVHLKIIWENQLLLRLIPAASRVRYSVAVTNLFLSLLCAALIVICLVIFSIIISALCDILS